MKKKQPKPQGNPIRTYLTDKEFADLKRRMNEEIINSISAYVRRLIIVDSKNK